MRISIFTTVLVMAVGVGAGCAREDSTVADLDSTGSDALAQEEWPYYGGTQWNERHATLTEINKQTVVGLVPRRVLQLGQVPYAFSASPLVIDGVLYVSASDGMVQAFDIRTGNRKWSFVHKIAAMASDADAAAIYGVAGPPCCSNQSRGVAYADGTIFYASLDAKT